MWKVSALLRTLHLTARPSLILSILSGMTAAVLWLGLKTINESISVSLYDEVRHGLQFRLSAILICACSKSWTGYAMRPQSKIIKERES